MASAKRAAAWLKHTEFYKTKRAQHFMTFG